MHPLPTTKLSAGAHELEHAISTRAPAGGGGGGELSFVTLRIIDKNYPCHCGEVFFSLINYKGPFSQVGDFFLLMFFSHYGGLFTRGVFSRWGGRGVPRIWQGGGQEFFFFSDLEICMSRSDMLRMAKPCALLGGFGGMPPRENFLKWCNLVYILNRFCP